MCFYVEYLCVVFVASGHLHRYFSGVCSELNAREQQKMHILTFCFGLMLFLARIFEQTQQINAIPGVFFFFFSLMA